LQLLRGSGKTTVLVERIINKIINEKIDIDKLLIVTFTNAAASEMRQRILEAIYSKIDENPENLDLQRQILLLNKANISTIHSFCLEVIKNYFYEIGISSNFRIGDTSEIELLKQETLEEVFENLYEEKNEEFIELVNIYSGYRDDDSLKELILKIYNYSQSMPFPNEWINESVERFDLENKLEQDFGKTLWGEILLEYFIDEIKSCISDLEGLAIKLEREFDLERYYSVILNDIENLKSLVKDNQTWNDIYINLNNIKFETWPRQAKTDCELKDECKAVRDEVKERVRDLTKKIFIYSSEEANQDIYEMYGILKSLQQVILEFSNTYQSNKKDKNIIDFNDIEHYALKILVKKDEEGNYVPTEIALNYKEKFVEIAIDEYQDSNLVQEYILTTISNGNNIFIVGDVKQSIYKFRQARPELFLEKYDKYILAEDEESTCKEDTKIQLFKNFRSRKNVLDFTNIIFENIMSKKLGDIDYNEKEYLNLGASFEECKELTSGKVELDIIDLSEQIEEENFVGVDAQIDPQDELMLEKTELEAKHVANRIKELLDSNLNVYDKKQGYRKVTYKDIVILLRTTSNVANIYEKELNRLELPVFSDSTSSYFETEEIQTILSVLRIIDNPNSDIPLVTVMRSEIGGFTDNELVEIRLASKNTSYYEALEEVKNNSEESKLKQKVISFLKMLEEWQQKQEYLALDELIWYIYESTNYYDFVNSNPNGELKTANLKLLFEKAKDYEKASFKGLYNFINYIDKISKSSGDVGSAKLIGENENVIRIMSIHKSKGLEFPVVFLCGTGKMFNVQDLNQSILLHQDMGFGPKYINYERKIEYNTLAKEAIRVKTLNEILSEEMRLLYVALTRAKEKLIITGCDKNLKKSISQKENSNLDIVNIRKAKSYLDWLELVYLNDKEKINDILEVNFINKSEFKEELDNKEQETESNIRLWNEVDEELERKVEKLLNWKYPYIKSTMIGTKASVTEISKGKKKELIDITEKPKFLSEKQELNKAEIGTLMHLILQKLDFSIIYTEETIKELIQELIATKIINENQAKYIDIQKILKFTKSDLYLEFKEAKEVHKEKPFYIYISSDEIYNDETDEKILVQGIIDLYYIDKNGRLILVDYKTDYVADNNEQELIEKYKGQLEIYKRALEQALNKKVEAVYIYSTYLDRKITL
jgi:ATP-dependent helicase/nuclease subunit A